MQRRIMVFVRVVYKALVKSGFLNKIPDKLYLRFLFRVKMGQKLDLKNPQTFNEKLQWLKIYDRKPEYTTMVDKFTVKRWVAERIGEEYIVPTLGVWESFGDIDFGELPNQFVLKCTHDSGGLVICRDKSVLDRKAAREKLEKCLKKNYYYHSREWPYKNVVPKVIAEEYLQDAKSENLPVYKIFNFKGEPKIIQGIQNDKTEKECIDYFDLNWNKLDMRQNYPNSSREDMLLRPQQLEKMIELSRKLSSDIPFVRTDFYEVNGKIYFSEFTFYSDGGMAKFYPEMWDKILGEWIKLSDKK